MTKVIYLHGFASSSNSTKALELNEYIKKNTSDTSLLIPDIENNIENAVSQIESLIKEFSPTALMGSSLGGFYGTYFAQKYKLKCVVINPAVIPPADMSIHLGENTNYSTGEKFSITQSQLGLLTKMGKAITKIHSPGDFMVLLQSEDELLDYKAAVSFYKGALIDVTYGGNHSFEKFQDYLGRVKYFLNMH